MTIGASDGQAYEDALDHHLDNPIAGPKPLPSENTKQPDQPILPLDKTGPLERKMREEHIRDILAPGVPQGPTDKAIIPGQTAPTYHPDQENTFPDKYTQNVVPSPSLSPYNLNTRPSPGGPGSFEAIPGPVHRTIDELKHKMGIDKAPTQDEIEDRLNKNRPISINTDHDVKSGAVASKNENIVYIDPSIPKEFHPFLAEHENVEKSLMAPPRSLPYDKAHVIATLAEKHKVEQAGMDWKTYTDAVDPYVAKAEKGDGKNPPPDPHEDPGDSIGHHVSSAKQLEAADIKIGKDNA